ncbi:hypothetical protein [uncultured Cetobacterium sp.]|uniref:hypothetical protein n=1 Tax=uncultured Cetobacterium sp. TaxID=527638 RepID=UPI002601E06C|nr:hypothetical protein [uncultured Cetobacterium sp.]
MPEKAIKNLLKGKSIDELLDLIILGLNSEDMNNKTIIESFKHKNELTETA